MGEASSAQRLLASLERLLKVPTGDLRTTMIQASDLIAESLRADEVDVFL